MNKQAQREFMHPVALGEGEGLSHEAAQTLTQGAVPAFNVAGFPFALVAQAVGADREHLGVGQPEVAASGPAAVVGWDAFTQRPGAFGRAISHEVSDHLAGLPTQGDPHPAHVGLGACEAPEFIEFEHVAGLRGQQCLIQRRAAFGFFSSQREIVCRATPKTRSAARRLRRSVATARSTSALRSGAVSRRLGCSTRHAPHARQRNCWWPQTFLPFLTMCSLPHAVQRGAASAANDDFSSHRPAWQIIPSLSFNQYPLPQMEVAQRAYQRRACQPAGSGPI